MTDFITSQASAEGQDVDLVQNIGGSLLQGMSNSLSTSAKKAVGYEKPKVGQDTMENEDEVNTERKQVTVYSSAAINNFPHSEPKITTKHKTNPFYSNAKKP